MKTINLSYDDYTIQDMKVFKVDEFQWIAAPSLLHALAFYDEQVGLEVFHLQDIEECDTDDDGMWDSTEITDGEQEAYEQGKLKIYEPSKSKMREMYDPQKPTSGDYGVFSGELCQWTSFSDVIKRQEVGTYVIACTEY
ncbi:hypothetical protein ACFC9N_12905 [Enterococcus casseliflavus]|uniref:hypothetical protein n=1 Tax=Enterococcus casseliflavus TaxID=37734 RepID=UPI0039A5992F